MKDIIAARAKERQIQAGTPYGEKHPQEVPQKSAQPPIDTRKT
jgi:hypothetical protein